MRASPIVFLKPILERKHLKNPLQQFFHLYFLDYNYYSTSLQAKNAVAFTVHTSNIFSYYNNQLLNKKMLDDVKLLKKK